jgi:2-polyprenyl-3-methyl-5-hydroxy-6-metoxy-1,4-benzoquinol methylase
VRFEQRDLLNDLTSLGQFDFIYCQEVLHHTEDPARAFRNLCKLLLPGGEIAIYVYKRKAPTREWVDDCIRDELSPVPYEEATRI